MKDHSVRSGSNRGTGRRSRQVQNAGEAKQKTSDVNQRNRPARSTRLTRLKEPKMKINSRDFQVRPGAKVKLKEWPTRVKPF